MSDDNEIKNCEILFDTGSVCVNTDHYNELVTAKAKLEIIENMYRSETSSYNYDTIFEYMFGKKGESEDAK